MIEPVDEERCDGCGQCMIYCALDILQFDSRRKKVFLVRPEECDTCYRCMRHCPQGALLVSPAPPVPYRVEPVYGTLPVYEVYAARQGLESGEAMQAIPAKTDIVVIGAGAAGLVAAISAREHGASVLVLDKAPDIHRTNTSRSGGNIRYHGERHRDPEAREQTVAERIQEALALTGGHVSPDLIRTFAECINNDIQWLTRLGMRWKEPPGSRRAAAVVTPQGDGPGLNKQLLRIAQRAGATVVFSVKVQGLLTDNLGAVTGVKVMTYDGLRDIEAAAVVLATGGFQANQEMLIRYMGADFAHSRRLVGSPYSTGDGHRMVEAVGAKLVHMDQFHCSQADRNWVPGEPGRPGINQLHLLNNCGIMVNRLGRRFVDETAAGDSLACSIFAQPGREAALILDEGIRTMNPAKVDGYIPPGTVIKVGSLHDLAQAIGSPYGELERTIAEFNAAVRDGAALGLDVPKARLAFKIATLPYYCVYPVWATLNCTLGGPQITTRSQVINLENRAVPGLYAAGEMVGGFYFGHYHHTEGGATYYTGNYLKTTASLATCLVFGRIAGREAVGRVAQMAAARYSQAARRG